MRKLKVVLLSNLYKLINFICYGDLPTSYYIKKGMKIGENFHRQTGTKFDPSHCWLIEIGDNVTVANFVQILAHDDSPRLYLGYGRVGKVVIGNNTFIGAKSLILPNVSIGDNVIIGAGSVVTRDIPSNSVAVGIPAKVVGTTDDYILRCKNELEKSRKYDSTYGGTKQTELQKYEIIETCRDGFGYIELGKVVEYGRDKQKE